ncbi:MAG: TRAP transporter permease [Gudongella sp.]|jgi:TRAP transporter 4TM/12TM fusion protein|nr:TRAP transporter permease [Gudongella sp.]
MTEKDLKVDDDKETLVDKEGLDVDQLMEEFDKDTSKLRKLGGPVGLFVTVLAIAMSLFHLYTAGFGTLLSFKQRSLHIIFAFVIGFLLFPATKKSDKNKASILDFVFAGLVLVVFGYIFFFTETVMLKGGKAETLDLILGGLAILLTLEVTRRVVGPELPIVAILFLAYAAFGPNMPGLLAHRGFSYSRIIAHMYMSLEGIMGIPLGVSATFVFMFILFGSILDKTGVGKFFIDLAFGLTGHLKSGPAMTAVVASGFMGSISGSSVANTVTTGAFTIPLMKKTGYKPYFAGAVEAAASTGGQIMPPVMGAAAFIMAEFTSIPYVHIIIAAAIPAILYYFAVGIMVHLEASKLGLKGLPREQLPKVGNLMLKKGYLLVPLVVIVYYLIAGNTPTLAAFKAIIISIVIAIIAAIIKRDGSFTWRDFLGALEAGAKGAVGVACACAAAGMIVGVVTLTGLGLRIAEVIVTLAQGKLLLTLFFTMIASIILGMGLPTTAKYIVLATMAVPALIKLEVNLMAAHLFILYFGVVADITPPVALAAYAGAGIAGANSMKTGFQAVKLALAAFIVPYIFAVDPALIMVKSVGEGGVVEFLPLLNALPVAITAIIGILCLAAAVEGYLVKKTNIVERVLLAVAALMLLKPGLPSDAFGIAVLGGTYLLQKTSMKKAQQV